MAEQQLVDYLKKAKEAGQSEDQSRSLLLKNGWTESEISEAFAELRQPQSQPQQRPQQPQQQYQPKPQQQPQSQPQTVAVSQPQQAKPQPQAQPAAQQQTKPQQSQYQSKPAQVSQQINKIQPSGSSHLVLKLLVVFFVLVVLSGAGLAYVLSAQIYNPSWNPFGMKPDKVIANMLINMKSVKSSAVKTNVEVTVKDSAGKSQGSLAFTLENQSDLTDASNPKVSLGITGDITPTGATLPLISVDADVIGAGKALYMILNKFTSPTTSGVYANILAIKGNWFKIDQNSIQAMADVGGISPDNINLPQNSQQATQQIQSLLSDPKMFSFVKQLSDQTINGKNTYHYLLKLNNASLKSAINKILGSQAALAYIDKIGDINVEIWVGKKDFMLYGYQVNKTINLSQILSVEGAPTLSIKLSSNSSNYNQKLSIVEPTGALKFEDVALPILRVQKINSNISEIGFLAESIFSADKNYSSLCFKGLLNGYNKSFGASLIDLNNDILKQGGKKPACFASATNYCVSSQLPDGGFVCAGVNSSSGTVKCISATTVCK